ncbi:MAG: protein kinase, partial [Nocardioides sp.]|uniref:protein kinase domain-containing protein n=1 Tax=Nocardioides sp. TaxID=35761 RepID=UPI003263E124
MSTEPTLIGGRYELGELLGRGGMAEVRQARDTRLGRTVAVKRLRTDLASDATFQARFRREAQSSASLNHPSIVSVYDTGEEMSTDGSDVAQPYIVMERVQGRTLRDIIREGRKILPERALEMTSDVLAALDYSHRSGIIHRDIKPGNVMLTPAGDVKVMDFGIARAVSDASSTMTQTAAVVGTAQYLSPEQARGETVDS